MKKTSKKGVTLVELCITIALLALVAGICASLLITGLEDARKNSEEAAFVSGANLLITSLNTDLDFTKNGDATVEVTTEEKSGYSVSTIRVTMDATTVHEYIYQESTGKIYYKASEDATSMICPYVKNAVFSRYNQGSGDGLKSMINIQLQCSLDDKWLETSFYVR